MSSAPVPLVTPFESAHVWMPGPPLPSPHEKAVATDWFRPKLWLSAGEVIVAAGGCSYVYRSVVPMALVPPSVATLTSTVPVPAGAVAVICVPAGLTLTPVALLGPNLTAGAFEKSVPVIVTVVPPLARPAAGLTLLIVGAPT